MPEKIALLGSTGSIGTQALDIISRYPDKFQVEVLIAGNNIVTVYKHNSSLLKETGDIVRAGDAISVVGDSGELYTSGPHLHFEIWYKGSPLDPEKHILF